MRQTGDVSHTPDITHKLRKAHTPDKHKEKRGNERRKQEKIGENGEGCGLWTGAVSRDAGSTETWHQHTRFQYRTWRRGYRTWRRAT
eukprot:3104016-Rhodomonas_salina.1